CRSRRPIAAGLDARLPSIVRTMGTALRPRRRRGTIRATTASTRRAATGKRHEDRRSHSDARSRPPAAPSARSPSCSPPGEVPAVSSTPANARRHKYRIGEENMAKEELLEFDGTVTEVLPDSNYRVTLDNEHQILAYMSGKMRKFRIRTGVGDRVIVEVSPY